MTRRARSAMLAGMSNVRDPHQSPSRHPVQAAEHELEHLNEIADKGESTATPAILIGRVAAFVLPLAAIMIALAVGIAYLVTHRGG